MGVQAVGCTDAIDACIEQVEHGDAAVDGIGANLWIIGEEIFEEAAISVAKDECVVAVSKLRKKACTTSLQGSSEGEVLHPAVEASDAVEARSLSRTLQCV